MALSRSLLITAAVICVISGPIEAHPVDPHSRSHNDPVVDPITDKQFGKGFNAVERVAMQTCASAALQTAAIQYWPRPDRSTPANDLQDSPVGNGINPAAQTRLMAITDVQRLTNGWRVSGLIDGRSGYPFYDPAYTGAAGDLSFSCEVDLRLIVSNLRVIDRMTSPVGSLPTAKHQGLP